MSEYSMNKPNGGLFVVLELRNRENYREEIDNDRQVLISMAKRLKVKRFYYEQLKNDDANTNKTDKKFLFNHYLGLIQSNANDNADKIDYLMLFVLAECEKVESKKNIQFKFFDNTSDDRMDISLNEILRPFLANVCEGLRDKPKIVMIHAPESSNSVTHKDWTEGGQKDKNKTTPNHADFYICISRPKQYMNHGTERSSFLLLLYSILIEFPEYEINQVITVLQRETMDYHKKIIGQGDHSLRLWNCSRLCKKLYLCPQMVEETEKTEQT